MLSEKEWPLLTSAISKLDPEVFSHPVWIRFGRRGVTSPLGLIGDLLFAAERLEKDDPSSACQVLLICAVCQNSAGRRDKALSTTQQALALAERNDLANEMIWAAWGASAVCFQEENYEQAARYLEYLKAELSEQNDWILADFIEVFKQVLLQPGLDSTGEQSGSCDDPSRADLLSLTFDWLRHWGEGSFDPNTGPPITPAHPRDGLAHPSLPSKYRQGAWSILSRAMKGELTLGWIERNERHAGRTLSPLLSILNSIQSFLHGRITEPPTRNDLPQQPKVSILAPSTQEHPNQLISGEIRAGAKSDGVPGHASVIPAVVQMLGPFSLTIQNTPVKMPASRGLSVLKYLLLHHKQDIPREVLMDIFWPDADPEAARNNLNVAMHNLRQAVRSTTDAVIIHFEDGAYGLSANLDIWLDVEEFERCIKEGQRLEVQNQLTTAVIEYEIAIDLYQGDFLADSPYEGWAVLDRERLRVAYLDTLDRLSQAYFNQERYPACTTLCQLILSQDPCREDAHRRLMQCYSRLGQSPLGLRQYQACVEALWVELEANPAPETTQLYERIRRHEWV